MNEDESQVKEELEEMRNKTKVLESRNEELNETLSKLKSMMDKGYGYIYKILLIVATVVIGSAGVWKIYSMRKNLNGEDDNE